MMVNRVNLIACLFLSCSTAFFSQERSSHPPQYSKDASGLQGQILALVQAVNAKDTRRQDAALEAFVIPDFTAWASSTLDTSGSEASVGYVKAADAFRGKLLNLVRQRQSDSVFPVAVMPFAISQSIPAKVRESASFTIASPFQIEVGEDAARESIVATFVFWEGAYRFVGSGVFPVWVERP